MKKSEVTVGSLTDSTATTDVTFRSQIYLCTGRIGMWFLKEIYKQTTYNHNAFKYDRISLPIHLH